MGLVGFSTGLLDGRGVALVGIQDRITVGGVRMSGTVGGIVGMAADGMATTGMVGDGTGVITGYGTEP